jgi:poly(A) polymerase
VRDLLLGKAPKDFDIVTDATRSRSRNSFPTVAGRSPLPLAHVVFGRDVIEVATFRGHHHKVNTKQAHLHQSDEGMLLRDNVYGTIEEDAERRDFNVTPSITASRISACTTSRWSRRSRSRGLELIGDPETRYREDPVRMLRAIRFAASWG